MVDEENNELSADDILEEERAGKLTASVGNDALPEDNDPPSVDEPDLDEDSDAEA
jgi:hypothetical protein